MTPASTWLDEKTMHRLFEAGLVLKAIFALLEITGGFIALFISQDALLDLIFSVTQDRLDANPGDAIALYLLRMASGLSLSSQHFIGLYLVAHGLIKAVLVAGLWREKLSFFPVGITVFLFFIAYQLYRFAVSGSILLLAISIIDAFVIWFIWREYESLKRHAAA